MPFSMGSIEEGQKGTGELRTLSNPSFLSNGGVSMLPELLIRGLIKKAIALTCHRSSDCRCSCSGIAGT